MEYFKTKRLMRLYEGDFDLEITDRKETFTVKAKWIPGYEGCYALGTNDVVYSLYKSGEECKTLTVFRGPAGHPSVNLYRRDKDNILKKTQLPLGNLKLSTYGPKRPENSVVKYKDGNPWNIDLSNLEWQTRAQRSKYIYFKGVSRGKKTVITEQAIQKYKDFFENHNI